MNKILWLASWFPNQNDPYTGDFIERHAQATSLFIPVEVLNCYNLKSNFKLNLFSRSDDFQDLKINSKSYSSVLFSIPILGSLFSFSYSLWVYYFSVNEWIKVNGKPQFIHVHVSMRCGIVALIFKKIKGIDFIVTEHFAGYLTEASRFGYHLNFLHKIFLKIILKNAITVTTVSNYAANSLNKIVKREYNTIYNVVDEAVFNININVAENKPFTFIHISTLTKQKNIDTILNAITLLVNKKIDFNFKIIGPNSKDVCDFINSNQLAEIVSYFSEMPSSELANQIKNSDCLILYSNFESFGCVNIEALACGKPLIVSNLEVFKEYIVENIQGYYGQKNSPDDLCNKMEKMILNHHHFNPKVLSEYALSNFSYSKVGEQFFKLYNSLKN